MDNNLTKENLWTKTINFPDDVSNSTVIACAHAERNRFISTSIYAIRFLLSLEEIGFKISIIENVADE